MPLLVYVYKNIWYSKGDILFTTAASRSSWAIGERLTVDKRNYKIMSFIKIIVYNSCVYYFFQKQNKK